MSEERMTRPATYDELLDFRARQLFRASCFGLDEYDNLPYRCETGPCKFMFRVMARFTLETERAVGIVPAPLEATEGMSEAGAKRLVDVWQEDDTADMSYVINAAIAATSYKEDGK